MTSAIYTMAGLGAFEESKVYKDNLEEEEEVDDRSDPLNNKIPVLCRTCSQGQLY